MSNKRRQRGKQLPSVPLELDSHSDEATCRGSDSASLSSKSASSSSSEHSQSTITEFDRFSDFDGFSSAPKSKSGSFTSASASERTGNSESSVHRSIEHPILPGSDDFERAQAFATNLKSTNIDPNTWMLYHMQEEMRKISDNTSSRYSDFSRNRNSKGELKGDDIFVFLHKFEAIMHSKCIPQEFWLEHVSPSLTGKFCEAYFNCFKNTSTYADMHVLLLDAGGYSLVEYLDSLDFKFRNMVLSLLWNTLHTGNINLK